MYKIINEPIIQTILAGVAMAIVTILNIRFTRKATLKDRSEEEIKKMEEKIQSKMENIQTKIENKVEEIQNSCVLKSNCDPAMKRVGLAIDKLEKRTDVQDKSINEIKVGIAYLVGKQGGDPKKMGLI